MIKKIIFSIFLFFSVQNIKTFSNIQFIGKSYGDFTTIISNYTSQNSLFFFGKNDKGQAGDGTVYVNKLTPNLVNTVQNLASETVIAISSGCSHTLALTKNGKKKIIFF
jgi:alpha-tubulin suppressor-like RCC1 family protein